MTSESIRKSTNLCSSSDKDKHSDRNRNRSDRYYQVQSERRHYKRSSSSYPEDHYSKSRRCSESSRSRRRSRSRSRSRSRHSKHHSRKFSRSRSSSPNKPLRHDHSRHSDSSRLSDAKSVPHELKIITRDASYFLLKSNNFDNLLLAKAESVWSTPPQNEIRINSAFKSKANVILIFCVKESSSFQGFARVSAESNKSYPPLPWVLPVGLSAKALSSVFTLDWISRAELPFARVRHLRNSLNDDRPVNVGRDGQELDVESGAAVCRMFAVDWSSADAQRAVEKAQLTLTLRGLDTEAQLDCVTETELPKR